MARKQAGRQAGSRPPACTWLTRRNTARRNPRQKIKNFHLFTCSPVPPLFTHLPVFSASPTDFTLIVRTRLPKMLIKLVFEFNSFFTSPSMGDVFITWWEQIQSYLFPFLLPGRFFIGQVSRHLSPRYSFVCFYWCEFNDTRSRESSRCTSFSNIRHGLRGATIRGRSRGGALSGTRPLIARARGSAWSGSKEKTDNISFVCCILLYIQKVFLVQDVQFITFLELTSLLMNAYCK